MWIEHQIRFVAGCLTLAWAPSLIADTQTKPVAEAPMEIRSDVSVPDSRNGGYLEIGLGVEAFSSPTLGVPQGNQQGEVHSQAFLDVNARYQYQCLFGEVFSQRLEQFTLGCNLLNQKHWSVDVVGVKQHNEMSERKSREYRGLNARHYDFMAGVRATGYFEDYILQLHALSDISDTHNGELYSIKAARHWQYGNWTAHGILGATYRSQHINDYYFSIDPTETSAQFPVYQAASSVSYIAELGLTYPLSERWVFRSFVRRVQFDRSLTRSPLILDDHGDLVSTSISYVF